MDSLSITEIREVFEQFESTDWKKAEMLAAFAIRGLHGMEPGDLLDETLAKLLAGQRRFPRGVAAFVVLATAMRSEASNARKRARRSPLDERIPVAGHSLTSDDVGDSCVEGVDLRNPEVELAAKDQLDAVFRSLEGDSEAMMVAMALIDGLKGAEATEAAGLDSKGFAAARKRLARMLTRIEDGRTRK